MVMLVCLASLLHSTDAAPPGDDPPRPPFWTDPQAMFENLFGKEGEVDEEVLAKIDVSAREEVRIGKTMVEGYLASLKQQRLRSVERGKDVEYLRELVAIIHPMMDNRDRYPAIKVYLVLTDRCDARWSYQAGYDCREMGRLFLRIHRRNGNRQLPVPEFFRSHPAGPDRHRAIMEEYERLQAEQRNDDLQMGIENLRRRTVNLP